MRMWAFGLNNRKFSLWATVNLVFPIVTEPLLEAPTVTSVPEHKRFNHWVGKTIARTEEAERVKRGSKIILIISTIQTGVVMLSLPTILPAGGESILRDCMASFTYSAVAIRCFLGLEALFGAVVVLNAFVGGYTKRRGGAIGAVSCYRYGVYHQ